MNRKTLYLIYAIGLSFLFLFHLVCLFLVNASYQLGSIYLPKALFVLYIIINETNEAPKTIRIINYILIPVMVIGLMLRIMHWPMGKELFWGGAACVFVPLLIAAIADKKERLVKCMILIYPFLMIVLFMNQPDEAISWMISNIIVPAVVALFLWVRIGKKVGTETSTVQDKLDINSHTE